MVSKTVGFSIAAGGIGMMVVGFLFVMHCDQTAPSFFGGTFCVVNTLMGYGVLLIILGLVLMIIGFILPYATAPTPPQPQQVMVAAPMVYAPAMYPALYAPPPPGYPAQPQAAAYPAQPAAPAARACAKCGSAVTQQFCPSCGTQQW